MSSRSPHSERDTESNVFINPAAFLGHWNPFLVGMAQSNGHAAEGIGTLVSEWQNFVGHRLSQDMQLIQKLAKCKSPDEIVATYADFWWNAYADYARQLTKISRLLPGVPPNVHSPSKEAANTVSSPRVAA